MLKQFVILRRRQSGRPNLRNQRPQLVERFDGLKTRLQNSTELSGTVRVATVYSIGLHELPPYIKQFMKSHPQVRVHIEYSRTDKVYEACLNNTIDFGIVALPLRRPNIAVIPLRNDKLVIVCSPDHRLAGRKRISIQELAEEEFVAAFFESVVLEFFFRLGLTALR